MSKVNTERFIIGNELTRPPITAYNGAKQPVIRGDSVEKRWLYVKDIVDDLGVHEETVRTWIRQKKLTAYRFGRDYRIKPEDYARFLEEHRTDTKDTDDTDKKE